MDSPEIAELLDAYGARADSFFDVTSQMRRNPPTDTDGLGAFDEAFSYMLATHL